MTTKIVGLVVHEMSRHCYEKFYIDKFRDSGVDFKLIDLSTIIYKKKINSEYCDKSVSNIIELKHVLENNKYFFLYFDYHISIMPIFNLLNNYKDKYYFQIFCCIEKFIYRRGHNNNA